MENVLSSISGAGELLAWFGSWPSFHDSEVLSVELHRTGSSRIRVHAFSMTSEIDAKGFYKCTKHCIVTFVFGEIIDMEIAHFKDGNILLDIEFSREEDAFVMTFSATYGLEGTLKARKLAIELASGIPADSRYNKIDQ